MSQRTGTTHDWDSVLSAAARLQTILPSAVLVGGTASAIHARHRMSHDADHVLSDLNARFDEVLRELESVAGRQTARVQRPVHIPGNLDGIETGVRQLIRKQPLETMVVHDQGTRVQVPTMAEILRIKGVLILKRNATRDYLDFVALADSMDGERIGAALAPFDDIYRQANNESPLQQLQVQLANPMPYDLDETDLSEYRNLDPRWHDWDTVKAASGRLATVIFDQVCKQKERNHGPRGKGH